VNKSLVENPDIFVIMSDLHPLEKSAKVGRDRRHVFGQATSEDIDLEGDAIESTGLAPSLNFWKQYGQLDYCHKSTQHPKYLLGDPVDWKIENGVTMIEGSLLDDWDMADTVYNFLMRKGRMGYSLGGKVLKSERGFEKDFGPMNRIQKVFINHVAVTPFPVNLNTRATLVPWSDFSKMLGESTKCSDCNGSGKCGTTEESHCLCKAIQIKEKSLNTASGAALRPESLECGGDNELRVALSDFLGQLKGDKVKKCFHLKKGFRDLTEAVDHFTFCEGLEMSKSYILSGFLWDHRDKFRDISL
jgi:hypothetical protein